MNRESSFASSDTLVVIDRSQRRRNIIIAVVAGIAILVAAFFFLSGGKDEKTAGGPGAGQGGNIPTVTVVVPGRSQVARVVTASGPLAAHRDQPVGVAGEGGMLTLLLVPAYYSIAIDIEGWIAGKFRRLVDNGEVHGGQAGHGGTAPLPAE